MKKLTRALSVLVAAVLLLAAMSVTVSAADIPYDAFADYGQQTFDVPATEGIKIDGVVSEGEYACEPIEVNKDSEGMAWLDWTKAGFPEEELSEILPYSIKYYVTYDKTGLYIAAEIVEASLYTRCAQPKDIWGTDSLEIDVSVDAYDDIEKGTFTQSYMLDRLRTNYCLWDDGVQLTPTGLCFTASTYGVFRELDDMGKDTYMITRNEDKQLTTYEMFISWQNIYMEDEVPNQVFLNFQLHLGDGRYMEYVENGYIACLGGLRYACQLSDEEKAELGATSSMALHIFNLTDADKLNGKVSGEAGDETSDETAAPETEAPTEEVSEAPTEAPTAAPETQAPETDAPAQGTDAPETEPEKSGCGSVIGMTAASLLMAAAAAVVLAKKD